MYIRVSLCLSSLLLAGKLVAQQATDAAALTVTTSVAVHAAETGPLSPDAMSSYTMTGRQVTQSAGTFGDLPRYLQTLPGLIGGNDTQNASFVRGGNPFENLYVVDKIEVPNINHLALAGSSGGLASMIDTESIGLVSFHSADIDSSFQSHISSLTEIQTLELPPRKSYSVDLGYSGAGFRLSRPIGSATALLVSMRESVTNLFLSDVGLNGSPEFTNSLVKYTIDTSSTNHFWITSLSGVDTLKVRPTWDDVFETNAYDTTYSGWRNTTGAVWQHTFHARGVGTGVVSHSINSQKLTQQDQINEDALLFRQNDSEGISQMKYQYVYANESGSGIDGGADLHLNGVTDDTVQGAGVYSPYLVSTVPLPSYIWQQKASPLDEGFFLNGTVDVKKRLLLKGGLRHERYGFAAAQMPGQSALLPRASLSFLAHRRVDLRVAYSRSAQLPPYSVLLGAPGNGSLGLIHGQQANAGVTVDVGSILSVNLEVYRKTYSGYPVSAEVPQLSLAAISPVITEPFSMMSMTSQGKGLARGVELSVKQQPRHHVFWQANLSYARAQFTGSDGVYRSGNADLPLVLNVMGGVQVKRFLITLRNTAASGRPYTPVLEAQSDAQNRMIFDASQINALRGSFYNRFDFAVNRDVLVHGKALHIHAGLINAFDRQNFFENQWRPRCTGCGVLVQTQIGLQPDLGVSYTF